MVAASHVEPLPLLITRVVPTTYQDGIVFHAGTPDGAWALRARAFLTPSSRPCVGLRSGNREFCATSRVSRPSLLAQLPGPVLTHRARP
jgi:hypothetical protein